MTDQENSKNTVTSVTAMNVDFDIQISCFEHCQSISPKQITLSQWINGCTRPHGAKALKHKQTAEKIMQIQNSQQYTTAEKKELKDKQKKTLPAITPGAVMFTRAKDVPDNEKIKHITGWMQFDIDPADNTHIGDAAQLRDQVQNIVYVAYCSVSVSGNGVWGLVKVKHPDRYRGYFEQLKIDFASRRINLDPSKGGNPTDLRFYSYDPQAYIARDFKVYDRFYKPPPKPVTKRSKYTHSANMRNPFEWCVEQTNKSHSFVKGLRTHYYVQLTRYCNIKGLPASETLNGCLGLLPPDCDAKHVESIVKNIYNKHANSHNKLPFTQRTPSQPKQPEIEQPTAAHPLVKVPEEKLSEQLPSTQKGFATETAKKTGFFDTIKKEQPENWEQEITALAQYFETATLPVQPLKLNQCSTITDVSKFIHAHLTFVKANNGKRTFLPYLNRLQELKQYLTVTVN